MKSTKNPHTHATFISKDCLQVGRRVSKMPKIMNVINGSAAKVNFGAILK